jgi:hypothetical protein
LKDVPRLAEQALRELDRTEAAAGPVVVESGREQQLALTRANQRFSFWNTLLDAVLRLEDFERAARIPKDMQSLARRPPDQTRNASQRGRLLSPM